MFFLDILVALLVGVVLTALFALVFGNVGPWQTWWLFLLIVFLAAWAGGAWVTPFGPTLFEVYWLPFLLVGLLFAILLAAVPPAEPRTYGRTMTQERAEETAAIAVSFFFWVFVMGLLLVIVLAYV
jgi:hypothetical protein